MTLRPESSSCGPRLSHIAMSTRELRVVSLVSYVIWAERYSRQLPEIPLEFLATQSLRCCDRLEYSLGLGRKEALRDEYC